MPADDSLLAQGTVDFRDEERRHGNRGPDTTDRRVRQILIDGAREAHAPQTTEREGIPVDRRCSGCGVDRPFCDQAFCARKHDDEED